MALQSAFVLAHLGISGLRMPPLVRDEGVLLLDGNIRRTVLHLLLCSLCRASDGRETAKDPPSQDLESRVLESFDVMSREEVAVAYQGLIDSGANHDVLKQKITGTYGFRL